MIKQIGARLFLLSMLSFFYCTTIYGINYQEIFLRANKYHKQQDYQKALELYQSIPKKGAAAWYNLGNCFYALDDYVQALVAFKRAQRIAPTQKLAMIDHNIQCVLDKLDAPPEHYSWTQKLYASIERATVGISLLVLQLLFLLTLYAAVFLAVWLRASRKKCIGIIFLCGCTVFFGILVGVKYQRINAVHGIVIKPDVSLFAGPDQAYHARASLALANQVNILEVRSQWYKVRHKKIVGWVPQDALAEI